MMIRSSRMTEWRAVSMIGVCVLSACTTLSQTQAPTAKLGTAFTAVAAAQQAIYTNADSGAQDAQIAFFRAGWLTERADRKALELGPMRAPPVVPPAELSVRRAVIKGLSTYGQIMTALASGTEDATLSTSATSIGQSLKTIATDKGAIGSFVGNGPNLAMLNAKLKSFGMPSTNNAGDLVATAINSVGEALIDYAKARQLQQTAKSVQPHLASLAAIFEAENVNLVRGVTAASNDEIDAARVKTELAVLNDRTAAKGQIYVDIRRIDNDFAGLKMPADDAPAAAAWDAVVKANAAVADAAPDLLTDAQDALDRAQAADAYYKKGLQK